LSVSQCNIKIEQPQSLYGRINQNISIPCNYSRTCSSNNDVQWYVFRTNSTHQLNIEQKKYRLDGANLHISGLSQSDEGVYHCAVSNKDSVYSGAQAIGTGTTLTVKEDEYSAGQILLIMLVVFLSVYSVIILTAFIGIK
ncbi:immunoglobulin superfamily member 6, partial [Clarias magur]